MSTKQTVISKRSVYSVLESIHAKLKNPTTLKEARTLTENAMNTFRPGVKGRRLKLDMAVLQGYVNDAQAESANELGAIVASRWNLEGRRQVEGGGSVLDCRHVLTMAEKGRLKFPDGMQVIRRKRTKKTAEAVVNS